MINKEIIYLDKEDILAAHETGLLQSELAIGGYDESCVEKRVIEPQTAYYDIEQYPGLFKKAAVYMYRITISHCFSDGNKRTAFLSTELFLNYNGYTFSASVDELYDFCLSIANHVTRPHLDNVEKWIQSHTKPFNISADELFH